MGNYEIEYENNSEQNLYTDGEDKKPKLVLIIGGIILLIVIVLIFFFACSGTGSKSDNNYLTSISVSGGELNPVFDKETLDYSVAITEEFTTVSCNSESSKATTEGCNKRIYLTEECSEHIIFVTAESKDVREYKLNICKQSKEAPVIKDVKVSPSGYTKNKVNVEVEVTSTNPLNEKAYSFDGGLTWQASNSFVVTENKTLEIKVKDKNNNESAVFTKEIKTIDKTQPSVVVKGSIESGVSTTSNVVLTAMATPDTTSSGYKYQWYKGESPIKGATKSTYTATASGSYKVKVTTGAGNSVTSSLFVVNKKANSGTGSNSYKLNINEVSGNPTSWTNKDVTLTVKATASNGLAEKAYSFDGGKTFDKNNSKSFSSNQTVKIVVKDKKGNTTSYSAYITKIDKTNPKVSISGNNSVGSKLTATVNPTKTSSNYKYQWYFNTEPISSATSSTYVATKSGDYQVKVTTGAGLSKTSDKFNVRPKVQGTVSLTSSVDQGKWTNGNVTLTAKVTNGTAKKYRWYSGAQLVDTTSSNVFTVTKEGTSTYKVEVEFTDGSKVPSGSVNIKIDKSAPSVPTLKYTKNKYEGSTYELGNWTKDTIYRQIRSNDALSGIDHFEYKNATSSSTSCSGSKSGNETLKNAGSGISNNKDYQISYSINSANYACFRTVDKAGNTSGWTRVQNVLVDQKGPKITIDARLGSYTSSTKYTSGNWTNQDIYITVTATDDAGMGDSMSFQYLPDNKWYSGAPGAWETFTKSGKTATAKINFTANRDHPFTVKATDSLGNYSVETILTKLDKTPPYTPTPTKELEGTACVMPGEKELSLPGKTRNEVFCNALVSNYNLGLLEEDKGGSGIDYCEGVWQLEGESSSSGCKSFGSAGNVEMVDKPDKIFDGTETINWVKLKNVRICATDAKSVVYLKRCRDKAGNNSEIATIFAFKIK